MNKQESVPLSPSVKNILSEKIDSQRKDLDKGERDMRRLKLFFAAMAAVSVMTVLSCAPSGEVWNNNWVACLDYNLLAIGFKKNGGYYTKDNCKIVATSGKVMSVTLIGQSNDKLVLKKALRLAYIALATGAYPNLFLDREKGGYKSFLDQDVEEMWQLGHQYAPRWRGDFQYCVHASFVHSANGVTVRLWHA